LGDSTIQRQSPVPTLRDIADEVGVTPSTVSAVLNNAPKSARYTAATKERIRAAAARLGYSANPLAKALRGQPQPLIGFISFNVQSTHYGHILNAIETVAGGRGYEVVTANMRRDPARLEPCIQLMTRWQVQGILLATIGHRLGGALAHAVANSRAPLVNMGFPESSVAVSCVNFDNFAAGAMLARRLYELGHRKLAIVTGTPDLAYFEERVRGFQHALQECGAEPPVVVRAAAPVDLAAGCAATTALLARQDRPTAIVGANDMIAIAALRTCFDSQVRVPGDVSIAGVDDIPLSRGESEGARLLAYLTPSVTTVRVPMAATATCAVDTLLALVKHPQERARPVAQCNLVPPEFVERESTAPPRP